MEKSEYITLDETRQLLHISKRKCSFMLQNGIIPCRNTGKKTRQYIIMRSDVESYIKWSKPQTTVDIPKIFSSKHSSFSLQKKIDTDDLRRWLADYWCGLPDAITQKQLESITGYSQTAVSNWIVGGKLRIVTVESSAITSPEWLIDFMSVYGITITRKSRKHKLMMAEYLKR